MQSIRGREISFCILEISYLFILANPSFSFHSLRLTAHRSYFVHNILIHVLIFYSLEPDFAVIFPFHLLGNCPEFTII